MLLRESPGKRQKSCHKSLGPFWNNTCTISLYSRVIWLLFLVSLFFLKNNYYMYFFGLTRVLSSTPFLLWRDFLGFLSKSVRRNAIKTRRGLPTGFRNSFFCCCSHLFFSLFFYFIGLLRRYDTICLDVKRIVVIKSLFMISSYTIYYLLPFRIHYTQT